MVDVAANLPPITVAFAARPPSRAGQELPPSPRRPRFLNHDPEPIGCAEPGLPRALLFRESRTRKPARSARRGFPLAVPCRSVYRVGRFELLSVARELLSLPAPEPPGAAAVIGDVGDF